MVGSGRARPWSGWLLNSQCLDSRGPEHGEQKGVTVIHRDYSGRVRTLVAEIRGKLTQLGD